MINRSLLPMAVLCTAVVVAACGSGARPELVDAAPRAETATGADAETGDPESANDGATTDTTATTAVTTTTVVAAPNGRRYPVLPDDPAALGAELVAVEAAIHDLSTPPSELPDLGHRQQLLYRVLSRNPQWDEIVLPMVPAEQRADVDDHLAARRAFIDMVSKAAAQTPTNVPAWAIIEPLSPNELLAHYRSAEAETGIEWEYLAAINLVETGMGRIRGLSTAGAQGPMQFLPTTWAEPGIGEGSIDDPGDAIHAAARYLVRRGGPDDMAKALWGYNNADQYVEAVERYASILRRDERSFIGIYHWEIHFFGSTGDLWLPVGYHRDEPQPIVDYEREAPWSTPPPGVASGD